MNEKYNAYVRSVADYFIEEMKKGTAPWQHDWDNAANVVPVSAVTDAPYRGTNALLLMAVRMSQGYGDNRWLTFRQVQELGGKVKKGEHGTKCIFWKHLEEKDEKDEDKTVERLIPCPFVVFNSEQCENLKLKKFETPEHEWTPLEAAERILDKSGAKTDAEKIKDYLFGIDKSLGLTAEPPAKKDKSPDNKEAKAALQTSALQTYKELPNYQQKYIQSSMLNFLTQPLSNPYQFQKPSQKSRVIDIER